MNSTFLKSSYNSPNKSSTKKVNNLTVKAALKRKSQEVVNTRESGKENTGHNLVASKKSHAQQVGEPSGRLDQDFTLKKRDQRLSRIQSHRYKPYEKTPRDSIPETTTPTSGVFRNSLKKSSVPISPVSSHRNGSVGPPVSIWGIPPSSSRRSSQCLVTENESLNSSIRPWLDDQASKQTKSSLIQSSYLNNQQKSNPLAGKGLYGVSTASLQIVDSAGVSSETKFCRLASTQINVESIKDYPVVTGTKNVSKQQDLDLSRANFPERSRGKVSVSKKRVQEQLLQHLNEIIDVQEILYSLSTDSQARKDFLDGARGALRLAPMDLKVIETIHRIITSYKRPKTVNEFILNQEASQQQASMHFKLLMEGHDEILIGSNVSYLEGKLIIQRVLCSGYFRLRRYNANVKMEI